MHLRSHRGSNPNPNPNPNPSLSPNSSPKPNLNQARQQLGQHIFRVRGPAVAADIERRRRRSSFGDDTELSQRSRAAAELERRASLAERTRRTSRDDMIAVSPYSYPVDRPGIGPCRIYV